jgi:hypothetical protein
MEQAINRRLRKAIVNLMEARSNQMLTATEWKELQKAFFLETGLNIEWQTPDELKG